MNKRENLLRALRRENPEYVPFGFTLCESLEREFEKRTGHRDYMEYYDMPYRYIDILPSKNLIDYSMYFDSLPNNAVIDEWGVAHIPGTVAHFSKMVSPMKDFKTPEEVWSFPMPDVLEDYRWDGIQDKVEALKDKDLVPIYFAIQIFEPAWYLRGLDNLLMDMVLNEDMAKACLDRMTEVKATMCSKIAQAGFDIIVYGDDVGTQTGMMMSPDLWRKWLKPTMKVAIKAAKDVNPDIIAYYHSDGVIYDIIPDLIEIGVDVLNPVQPECMDPVKIKEMYGDKLSFWGTIGTQTIMPFGTPEDVEETVKRMIETVGKGGGLVIAPTHLLEPEVPWKNIEALVKAVHKYGKYSQ
ncbi:MAG: hypothetical protein HPY74_15470 [Firmicutes bacterium]|nr:hypothetical protein [Bacillota bacterium]